MTAETELRDDLADLFRQLDNVQNGTEDGLAMEVVRLFGDRIRPPDELDALGVHLEELGGALDAALTTQIEITKLMGIEL